VTAYWRLGHDETATIYTLPRRQHFAQRSHGPSASFNLSVTTSVFFAIIHVGGGHDEEVKRVPIESPLAMTSPILYRDAAPAAGRDDQGHTPRTMAAVVIKIGRSLMDAASRMASCFDLPCSRCSLATFDHQNTVFADQPHQQLPRSDCHSCVGADVSGGSPDLHQRRIGGSQLIYQDRPCER